MKQTKKEEIILLFLFPGDWPADFFSFSPQMETKIHPFGTVSLYIPCSDLILSLCFVCTMKKDLSCSNGCA